MKISFDLDDTLIPGSKTFPVIRGNCLHRLLGLESIRSNTIKLFKQLSKQGHQVGIYTTSYRSVTRITVLFMMHGFRPKFVINQTHHLQLVNKGKINCSKYPLAFGIDIHVDDSEGVKQEGQRYGFRTIIVNEYDNDWVTTVLKQVNEAI